MITEQDLQEAIAECQGQRNPNANTAIKLAAFLTIQKELFGNSEHVGKTDMLYSYAAPPVEQAENYVRYDSGTEFSQVIHGMDASKAWAVMDELMDKTLRIINPRLYNGVLTELSQK